MNLRFQSPFARSVTARTTGCGSITVSDSNGGNGGNNGDDGISVPDDPTDAIPGGATTLAIGGGVLLLFILLLLVAV
jgi:hypothetical protein